MRKVKAKLDENQLRRNVEKPRPIYLLLAGNDTVPISVWRDGGVPFTIMPSILIILD